MPAVPASASTYPTAGTYAASLVDAVDELVSCADKLLVQLLKDLLHASGETSRQVITGFAKALEDEVLDPEVRAFVLTLANDTVDSDADWMGTIATVVAEKAPSEWTDRIVPIFGTCWVTGWSHFCDSWPSTPTKVLMVGVRSNPSA